MRDDSELFDEYLDSLAEEQCNIEAECREHRRRHRKRIGWFRYAVIRSHEYLETKCSRVYGRHIVSRGAVALPWWAKYLSRTEFVLRNYIDRNPKKYRAW